MFSYFEGGVLKSKQIANIDFTALVIAVLNNPYKELFEKIRQSRALGTICADGEEEYKKLKKELRFIHVNLISRRRKIASEIEFQNNFICSSGYIFLDFDFKNNLDKVDEFKNDFIVKYSKQVALVCKSSSNGGISVLIRYNSHFKSISEYNKIREYIIDNYFFEHKSLIDSSTTGVGQIWFISYDPDAFISYENTIEIPDNVTRFSVNEDKREQNLTIEKPESLVKENREVQCNRWLGDINILNFSNLPSYKDVFNKMYWSTQVKVENPIVDLKEIEFYKLFIKANKITQGQKKKIYTKLFLTFIEINTHLDITYAISFISYINDNRTDESKMLPERFRRFMLGLVDGYKSGKFKVAYKEKSIHFNPLNKMLSPDRKMRLANFINGKKKEAKSIEKIIKAKNELIDKGFKLTRKLVSDHTKIHPKTVGKHWDKERIDLDEILKNINENGLS